MRNAGLSPKRRKRGFRCGDGTPHFAHWRSRRVDVPQETHDTLRSWRRSGPLVAITNGNARPELFGLERLFSASCCAPGRMAAQAVCRHVPPCGGACLGPFAARADLHVGDDLTYRRGRRYSLWDAGLLDQTARRRT